MNKNLIHKFIIFSFASVLLFSCKEDLDLISSQDTLSDDRIRVTGSIKEENSVSSRGEKYIAKGNIDDGVYNLVYPTSSSYMSKVFADVTFGNSEDPTTGFVTYEKEGKIKDLKWDDIYFSSSTATSPFYLHNLDKSQIKTLSFSSSHEIIYYLKEDTKYIAAPLDSIHGTNDIIGGYLSSKKNATSLNFDMYHGLSLLRLHLRVFGADDEYFIDLSDAKIYISDIYTQLNELRFENFNGTFRTTAKPSSLKDDLVIVGKVNNEERTWNEECTHYDLENNVKKYTSYDFILPPQTLSTGPDRPRLVIEIPTENVTGKVSDKGKISKFSGPLPDLMFNSPISGDSEGLDSYATFQFLTGKRLTLTANLNSPDTELYFLPAQVEGWTSQREYLTLQQAGIYTLSDFQNLIFDYQKGYKNKLEQFGYIYTPATDIELDKEYEKNYVFQFWRNITLKKSNILNSMDLNYNDPEINFTFFFNGCTISIEEDNGEIIKLSGAEGQQTLYNLVTGNDTEFKYIKSTKDFTDMLAAMNIYDKATLGQYGIYDPFENTWDFDIKESFEIPIDDIFQKLNRTIFSKTYFLNLNDNIIKIKFPDNSILEIDKNNMNFLTRILEIRSFGIYSANDVELLKILYNNHYSYKKILSLFGEYSEDTDKWTFWLFRDITVDSQYVCGALRPDGDLKPDYSFKYSTWPKDDYNKTLTITSQYQTLAYKLESLYNSRNLYTIFSGKGEIQSASNKFENLVKAYQNKNDITLWLYGNYNVQDNCWNFIIDFFSVDYSDLKGCMIPNEEEGFLNFKFKFKSSFVVLNSPTNDSYYNYQRLTGEEGEQILYEMVTGTYKSN